MVYLITGKKSAGKSTYAERFAEELKKENKLVAIIDGDEQRKLNQNFDFSPLGRERNMMQAARLAKEYEQEGFIVLVAMMAPTKDLRERMRHYWKASRVIYIPGGYWSDEPCWGGVKYERPDEWELLN